MKRILSLVLVVVLSLACLVACGGGDSEYTLSIAVDNGLGSISRGKVTSIAVAIVADEDGKIVAARFDSFEQALSADGSVARITTKVEKGAGYTGMSKGSWEEQAKAFENFLVGKTAADVAALDTSADNVSSEGLVAGCTMKSSVPVFQTLVAKAFAYEQKVSFATSEEITLGFGINAAFAGTKITADFGAVVFGGDKVVAAMIDSVDTASYAYGDATTATYTGTKNELGEDYDKNNVMAAGDWYKQAQSFADRSLGMTLAELANLSTDKVEGGCTIYAGGLKSVLVLAAGYAR